MVWHTVQPGLDLAAQPIAPGQEFVVRTVNDWPHLARLRVHGRTEMTDPTAGLANRHQGQPVEIAHLRRYAVLGGLNGDRCNRGAYATSRPDAELKVSDVVTLEKIVRDSKGEVMDFLAQIGTGEHAIGCHVLSGDDLHGHHGFG